MIKSNFVRLTLTVVYNKLHLRLVNERIYITMSLNNKVLQSLSVCTNVKNKTYYQV